MVEEKWAKAKEVLEKLKVLYPEYVGADNAYLLLATVYRRLSDPAAEHKVLEELAMKEGDARPAYLRLMAMDEAASDWRGLAKNARRLLAVNPLIPAPHRSLARAAEQLGERDEAVTAYRALAMLDDTDPAEVHYHLAKLLRQAGKPLEARREVLKSLEEAPALPGRSSALARTDRKRLTCDGLPAVKSPSPSRGQRSHDPKTPDSACSPGPDGDRRRRIPGPAAVPARRAGGEAAEAGGWERCPTGKSPRIVPACRTGRWTSISRTMSSPL